MKSFLSLFLRKLYKPHVTKLRYSAVLLDKMADNSTCNVDEISSVNCPESSEDSASLKRPLDEEDTSNKKLKTELGDKVKSIPETIPAICICHRRKCWEV